MTVAADPVFESEQQHLTQTYAKLVELERACAERLEANRREVQEFKGTMDDELNTDFDGDDIAMETFAEYAVMNNVVDSFNIAIDLDTETLARLRVLLKKPYFAKVVLQFPGKPRPREIYLGATGAADEMHRQIVVDWRSPVAETYYSQQSGPMTYEANGRTVEVDLQLRRQFALEADRLDAYFDTSVAIEDPLLLASLANQRTSQLQAITATIQKEQNEIIRHADVPALLVRGVAGSGKTSVMLQRIAYLLFQQRANLTADQVYLISPNPVFARYIADVLPELGEKNPHTLLWSELMERLGAGNRNLGAAVDPAVLRRIDAEAASFELAVNDMRELRIGERVLLSVEQIWKSVEKFAGMAGPRRMLLAEEDMAEKLERKLAGLAQSEAVQEEMLALDEDEQERIFGRLIDPVTEEEIEECARTYVDEIYGGAFAELEQANWLRLDRIAMRMLGTGTVSGTEWLYLKMAITGKVDEAAKFVMVDEVQDYSAGQLMVLARYFSNAHFLLLGDPNQAIKEGTASFAEMREVFEAARGQVDECRLMTSYRSSPEITALFASLVEDDAERMEIASVQRPGVAPRIEVCEDLEAYRAALVGAVEALGAHEGLGAVLVASRKRATWMHKQLVELMGDDAPVLMREGMRLPDSGAILIDLPLAKGLEFDRVVVADAQAEEYPPCELSRRRLYTAISRATQEVTVLSQGPLTPLLAHR